MLGEGEKNIYIYIHIYIYDIHTKKNAVLKSICRCFLPKNLPMPPRQNGAVSPIDSQLGAKDAHARARPQAEMTLLHSQAGMKENKLHGPTL